ncbi:MAG: AbrB/MazE/SpoVT family DNA-binding domain-containing protein [Clostridiales bacterium]|nr:AbrB/MazE/SpoVT family DNA-binding domain-containing protein [Clostridiales bacterium]MCF8023371.1 AbrB/MazE/SpoVT family DNA-binding domain-containing protein [Clostridiales bacterium]
MQKEKPSTGILTIRDRGLIAVKSLLKELGASDAEIIRYEIKDGKIILTPQVAVDSDQAWFWSKRWQKGEIEAERDKLHGRTKRFAGAEELMEDLLEGLDTEGNKTTR